MSKDILSELARDLVSIRERNLSVHDMLEVVLRSLKSNGCQEMPEQSVIVQARRMADDLAGMIDGAVSLAAALGERRGKLKAA